MKYIKPFFIISNIIIFGIVFYLFGYNNNDSLDCTYKEKLLTPNEVSNKIKFLGLNNLNITEAELKNNKIIGLEFDVNVLNDTNKAQNFYGVQQLLTQSVISQLVYFSDRSFGTTLNPGEKHNTKQYIFIKENEWFKNKGFLSDSLSILYGIKVNKKYISYSSCKNF